VDEHGARRLNLDLFWFVRHPRDGTPLVASFVVAELLIAVDFDGTITMRDTLHVIVDAHGHPGVWDELEPALRAGEITVEQAMEQQFATVTAPHDEIIDLVLSHAGTREGFPELVRFAEDHDHRLVVMSAGFRCVIDEVLDGLGVGHLEVVANDAVFTHDGCTLVWSEDRGDTCHLCGRKCKRHAINERFDGDRLVYVGDGISDRCASLLADVVFARAQLADWLDEQGVGYIPYGDFHDVLRWLTTDPSLVEAA
jgi:2-hydroxy-3-keto-5-methylthiopentenyl-1-phosphate phosphatase